MYRIDSVGTPISQGLRLSSDLDPTVVFARCQYEPLAEGTTEFSGLESVSYIAGELEHLVDVDEIYLFRFSLMSEKWSELHKWVAWHDPSKGYVFAHKDITEARFSISHISALIELCVGTLEKAGSAQFSMSISMNRIRTIVELPNSLFLEDDGAS